jgi:SAM-dependent methyltransferase
MKLGDFTGLAQNYTRYRQGYAPGVLAGLIGMLPSPPRETAVVDVGAGTGIWTRMLASAGFVKVTAVEPNADMRGQGAAHPTNGAIDWREGSGEATGLPGGCASLVTMASSFHWVDFDKGMDEFARLLVPGGRFCALWNPRLVEANPLTAEIEAELDTRMGGQKRVSSGASGITETLTERLWARRDFEDVVYLEGRHAVAMPREAYLGAWWSVNDVRAKLGEAGFAAFMEWVEGRIAGEPTIEAVYRTRAWATRKRA